MIGALLLLAAQPSLSVSNEEDKIESFVMAMLARKPSTDLPFAAPDLVFKVSVDTVQWPSLKDNLDSVEGAIAGCQPLGMFDLGPEQNDHWYEVHFKCPRDDKKPNDQTMLTVVTGQKGIKFVVLTIGVPNVVDPSRAGKAN